MSDLSAAQVIAEELALIDPSGHVLAGEMHDLLAESLARTGHLLVKLPEASPCFRPIVMWQAVCHHCEKVFDADEEIVAWTDPHGAQDYAECAEWDFRTIDGVMQATCWSCVEAAQIAAEEATS